MIPEAYADVYMDPFLLTQSNPIQKQLVLKLIRKLGPIRATIYRNDH